jgi:branched-subunit amino acid aminotransferase/4-amino-4-deoxychorismate lyase
MSMTEPLVYLRGRMVPASQASLPLYDAGFVLGATVTELTRTFHRRLFRLANHLERLFRSLQRVRIDIGLTPLQLEAISEELVAHNAGLLSAGDELGLVHLVTPGAYPTYAGLGGVRPDSGPTLCIHTFPLPFELWAARMQDGARLVTPAMRQVPPACGDPSIKHRSRMHYYLADLEARDIDPPAMALLLDLDGHVTETNSANFLMVADGTLVTPTLHNTLPGVSRRAVLELASGLGIPCVERDFRVDEAMQADEALLTSTPWCIMPVSHINGTPLAADVPGPVTRRLQDAWSRMVGVDITDQIVTGAARRTSAAH